MPGKHFDATPIEVALWIAERAVGGQLPTPAAVRKRFTGMSRAAAYAWCQRARVHFEQAAARTVHKGETS